VPLPFSIRHSREGGNPFRASARADEWIPAFAGMTIKEKATPEWMSSNNSLFPGAARILAAQGGSICENLCHLWPISSLLTTLARIG
jgi:hypothetical protein